MALLALAASIALIAAGCSSTPDTSPAGASGPDAPAAVGELPQSAREIMAKPAYAAARWIYQVSDQDSGDVLYSSRPGELAFTGSTAKLFTVGTLFDARGPDSTFTTPVYALGPVDGGVLAGDLVLVGSGDLTLGGREAAEGKAVDGFSATTIDHVYGDIAPNGAIPAGDPLAGLDDLARQVAASGITRVAGDVVVDDGLWQPYAAQEGPVPSVYVNDNLLDVTVTPGAVGATATLAAVPQTGAYRVVSEVQTVAGADSALAVAADAADPTLLRVTGTIGDAAGPRLTIYRVPDSTAWARTLFTEALGRAGVAVTTPDASSVPPASAPPTSVPAPTAQAPTARRDYSRDRQVAAYVSPPLSTIAGMVLRTSYNTGANAFLCLIAVGAGSADCVDGLKTITALADKAGIKNADLILIDGQGGDPASATPAALTQWLRFVHGQPWGDALVSGLPVLGETGSLAGNGLGGPSVGKISAKTGTSAHVDPATGLVLFNVQALAGYMTAADGRALVFDVLVSGATFSDPVTGIGEVGADVADVAAAFQQAVS